MRHKTRTISRVVPPEIDGEPPCEPPHLNTTASHYLGDAWLLFAEVASRCGVATARFIFQKCISEAEKQEDRALGIQKKKAAQKARSLTTLPTAEQIAAADRKQISNWWARLPDRKITEREKPLYALLLKRYIEFGGYTKDFNPNLPPLKKHGAVTRHAPNRELPALFDSKNPNSAFSIEKAKRGGNLTQIEFAETLVPRHGHDAEHVLANLRYHRKPKI
jgi:hypothetical protein